jgi:hypothetical protein
MNLKRAVTLGAAGGVVAVWLAAAATSNTPPAQQVSSHKSTPVEVQGAELAAEIARLHERLRPTATPLQARDLFRFRRGIGATTLSGFRAPAPAPAALPAAAPAGHEPSFTLVGLAEDISPDGPVRTAIISGSGDLFLVKEGDAVTTRYRVGKISADDVELTDVRAGTSLRLGLK